MARSKLYFYLSCILIIISFYFNTRNPLLNMHFNSMIKLIFVCSIINAIILILAIIFSDKSIKIYMKIQIGFVQLAKFYLI